MRLHWMDSGEHRTEESEVPNAYCLRYVTAAALTDTFLSSPLLNPAWDYTCEHPSAPCVRQPGPPQLVVNIISPVQAEPPRKRALSFDFADD